MTVALITLMLSVALCGCYVYLARRLQILDHPNDRSSHALPTPHGGGVPMFVALLAGVVLAALSGVHWEAEYLLLLGVAAVLVAIGVVDDLRGLSVAVRFTLYALCCVVAVDSLYPFLTLGSTAGLLVGGAASMGLLWLLNLYNFMDGIDGFAALQCILACAGAGLIVLVNGSDPFYPMFCLLLVAAQTGFVFWNWPAARLFMGDAGSIPTGFLLGGLALLGSARDLLPLSCWLILLACFITDASATLIRRVLSGQPFWQAHRQHAYQRLSRYFGGHLPVVFMLLAIVSLWLFPLAWFSALYPKYGVLLVILAYVPLLAGMAKASRLG